MRNLSDTIESLFRLNSGYCHCYRNDNTGIQFPDGYYMEIPINTEYFELPLFAYPAFKDMVEERDAMEKESLVAYLGFKERIPRYVSLDKAMGEVLAEPFRHSGLCYIKASKLEELYFGTAGAVFDKHMRPLLMCSWLIHKNPDTNTYDLECPIVRVDPLCFINQSDTLQRFIAKKFLSATLSTSFRSFNPGVLRDTHGQWHIKVEICDNPFVIKQVEAPSVSTTDEVLLKTALDHLDDIL